VGEDGINSGRKETVRGKKKLVGGRKEERKSEKGRARK
jgi:hypothetical protein